MEKFRLELKGMTCDSCEKLVRRVAEENGAVVRHVDVSSGRVTLIADREKMSAIKQQLAEKGYPEKTPADVSRGDYKRVFAYVLSVIGNQADVETESKLLNHVLESAIALFFLTAIAYIAFFSKVQNSVGYIPLLVLAIVGPIAILFSYNHMACYKKSISCMNGMMVGMTIGMISGFMVGALVGATNGMFIGSTAGVIVGVTLGGVIGSFCGVMGAMEGIMAGLMSGIMGAMTSVMLINDHLVAFLYLLFAVCTFILGGLSYMMYREAGSVPKARFNQSFMQFAGISIVFSLLIMGLMFYGPKYGLLYPPIR